MDETLRSIASGGAPPQHIEPMQGGAPAIGPGGTGTGTGIGESAGAGTGGVGKEGETGSRSISSAASPEVQFQGLPPGTVPDATIEIVSGASLSHNKGHRTKLTLYGRRDSSKISTVVSDVSAIVTEITKKGGKVIAVTYEIQDAVTFDLVRAAAARSKGEPLTCFRLCISKGRHLKYPSPQ